MRSTPPEPRRNSTISFAGEAMLLDASGALYWPGQRMQILADLHFEKASFLARSGLPIPRYDTRETLRRLQQVIDHYRPEQVVCLGDSFHDREAYARLESADRDHLHRLVAATPRWQWVLGNHDPAIAPELPGEPIARLPVGPLLLTHEPEASSALPQMIGHFHPKLTLRLGGQRISGPTLVVDDALLILPAFGSFTGGLSVEDPALRCLLRQPTHYLLYRDRIWKVRG